MLLHVGVSAITKISVPESVWQKLAPETRVLSAGIMVLAIALTPNGHWWSWLIYGLGLLVLIGLTRVNLSLLLQRLIVESAFVGVIVLGALFREGGDVVWQWGWIRVTTLGLLLLGSVLLKAGLSLVMMNVLTLTTPVPALLQALVQLRVPPLLVAILATMIRYLGVLMDEFNGMRRAATARNFSSNNLWGSSFLAKQSWQRQVIGNMIGSLFIRTVDRGERVHRAMLARGYQGLPPTARVLTVSKQDMIALALTVMLALLGQAIYWPLSLVGS